MQLYQYYTYSYTYQYYTYTYSLERSSTGYGVLPTSSYYCSTVLVNSMNSTTGIVAPSNLGTVCTHMSYRTTGLRLFTGK